MQSLFIPSYHHAGCRQISTSDIPVKHILSVLGCCLMISLLAQVRIPLPGTTIPMTLQSLAVLLTGFALTPLCALTAMVLYIACGVAGMGVFSPGSLGFVGPTGGYILGFVLGAWIISTIKGNRCAGAIRLFLAGVVGTFAMFSIGFFWLIPWCGGEMSTAFSLGVLPFIPKAVFQLVLAVMTTVSIRSLVSIYHKKTETDGIKTSTTMRIGDS